MECTRRRVISNTAKEMRSLLLTGPEEGREIWNTWDGVTASEENGDIYLIREGEKYLKITICPDR